MKPLLLVDVDGVISLFGFAREARPAGRFEMVDGIAHFLSATAGEHLRRLSGAFEPVWCTGWEEKANEYLPHALGLAGPWPYLSFERAVGRTRAHWKLDAIDAHAGVRPLAWIDDAHGEACEAWATARVAPTLLVTTEPAVGMTEREVTRLLAWAQTLGAA
ncbi:MAG TPA: HAD domain-containing protein [Conexibacter sp.]|nr:HAD domain-containing protein [Conexibacter sp.]